MQVVDFSGCIKGKPLILVVALVANSVFYWLHSRQIVDFSGCIRCKLLILVVALHANS